MWWPGARRLPDAEVAFAQAEDRAAFFVDDSAVKEDFVHILVKGVDAVLAFADFARRSGDAGGVGSGGRRHDEVGRGDGIAIEGEVELLFGLLGIVGTGCGLRLDGRGLGRPALRRLGLSWARIRGRGL
jgi:hypothetical protein